MFAWKPFLDQRGVPYREGGRNEVLVHCPFCGESDQGHHLSISTRNRGWRCFRNRSHKGRSYARLLSNLIACSEEFARELLGERTQSLPDRDTFASDWRRQLGMSQVVVERPTHIDLPSEVKPLSRSYGRLADVFWNYLHSRGYGSAEAGWLAKTYRLQYSISGKWAYRLLLPIYDSAGKLMTWTGRAVLPEAEVRYLSLSAESSVESPPNLLLGLDFLWRVYKPRCLVVTEGPFDAMAVTALGNLDGIWGTCLFGVQVSDAQAVLLDDLTRKFDRMRLLVDPDAAMKVMGFRDKLPKSCQIRHLPPGFKDPGELPKGWDKGQEFVRTLLQ